MFESGETNNLSLDTSSVAEGWLKLGLAEVDWFRLVSEMLIPLC